MKLPQKASRVVYGLFVLALGVLIAWLSLAAVERFMIP